MDSNIVLAGFMGTGKSSVGRLVSQRLNRPFVDMDALIEERTGKLISEIFRDQGELVFRQMEADLCLELMEKTNLVIATGGGTFVNEQNRERLMKNGQLFCLQCSEDVLDQRLKTSTHRPLLKSANLDLAIKRQDEEKIVVEKERIKEILSDRKLIYDSIPWQIDTSQLSIEQVADKIIEIQSINTVQVHFPQGSYNIYVRQGICSSVGGILRSIPIPSASRIAIVSNTRVAPLYLDLLRNSLLDAGYKVVECILKDGEEYKNLTSVAELYDQFLNYGVERQDTILALGGGVVGDVAGFAAATYLRGIRFVQVPTTLLSMVDASIGGKTGVDLPQGKNLVGAFKQPSAVIIDPSVLATLSPDDLSSGMAEVIKHAIIADITLFDILEKIPGDYSFWWQGDLSADWLVQALQVKVNIVEQDPFEQGWRAVLNLGHTLAHALEILSHFTIRHGHAVGIGLVAAAYISCEMGLAERALPLRIENVLQKWGLPVRISNIPVNELLRIMAYDKKKQAGKIRWILPCSIGAVVIRNDIPENIVISVLKELGAI